MEVPSKPRELLQIFFKADVAHPLTWMDALQIPTNSQISSYSPWEHELFFMLLVLLILLQKIHFL